MLKDAVGKCVSEKQDAEKCRIEGAGALNLIETVLLNDQ
jgi:hypothetical protein